MIQAAPKQKTCKACRVKFTPQRQMQCVCSPACAITLSGIKKDKAARLERTETAKALARIKPRAQLIKEAQVAVNAYVRARDANLPCVSCGRHHQGQWHAGHYRSTGSRPDLRFDLANIHKQCAPCNSHLSGNLIPYRAELIRRIGQAEVDRLEGPPVPTKLERHEIIELRQRFVAMRKSLEVG